MSKVILMTFLAVGVWFTATPSAAVEVPDYISSQTEDVGKNVCSIINALSSNAVGSQEAEDDAEIKNIQRRKSAADLYAEAIVTRTTIIKEEKERQIKEKAGKAASMLNVKDKETIMSDRIQPPLINIAKRLNAIASLEASMAVLEGTMIFTDLPKENTDTFNLCGSKEASE